MQKLRILGIIEILQNENCLLIDTLEVCKPKLEEKIMRYSLILIYSTINIFCLSEAALS